MILPSMLLTTEIQKLFPQSVQCFMGRPDYDFSFFLTMTSSHAKITTTKLKEVVK